MGRTTKSQPPKKNQSFLSKGIESAGLLTDQWSGKMYRKALFARRCESPTIMNRGLVAQAVVNTVAIWHSGLDRDSSRKGFVLGITEE